MTVRSIAKVADAYKLDRKKRRRFQRNAAQPYDDRIFRLCSDTELSLWTMRGRMTIAYQCGARQRALLAYRKGEVDLMYIRGVFYLAVVCDVLEPEEMGIERILGVDFGIVNLAVDSDGTVYCGTPIDRKRQRYRSAGMDCNDTGPARRGGIAPAFRETNAVSVQHDHTIAKGSWRGRNAPLRGLPSKI